MVLIVHAGHLVTPSPNRSSYIHLIPESRSLAYGPVIPLTGVFLGPFLVLPILLFEDGEPVPTTSPNGPSHLFSPVDADAIEDDPESSDPEEPDRGTSPEPDQAPILLISQVVTEG